MDLKMKFSFRSAPPPPETTFKLLIPQRSLSPASCLLIRTTVGSRMSNGALLAT